ncbi:MAG: amino acid ABC transporter permease [Deltaproteobacteria bacterium]|nr:amino acid ABC transporter permease [Deltaproteobacteria bacterium]
MKGWDWSAFIEYLASPYLLEGVWVTIWLTAVSLLIGLVCGLIAALLRMSKNPILQMPARLYTWVWRGTPLLVQLIILYTGLPQIGIKLSVIQSSLIGLGVNEGAYLSEIIRAGIMSVDRGQFNAARALGMNYRVMMRRIILPQAARIIVPDLGNRFNGLLKFSSLASVISLEELMRRAQMLTQVKFAVLEIFIVASIYYLVLTTIWGLAQARIEEYFERGYSQKNSRRAKALARTA